MLEGTVMLCVTLRPPGARSEVCTGTCLPGAQQVCFMGLQRGCSGPGMGDGAKASAWGRLAAGMSAVVVGHVPQVARLGAHE